MGVITLHDMEFFAHHGCFEEEQTTGAYFSVDVSIDTNMDKPAKSDNLDDAVNYQHMYNLVRQEMQVSSKLLEHVAERILQTLHKQLKNIDAATVTIRKLNPPLGGKVGHSAVTMNRQFDAAKH